MHNDCQVHRYICDPLSYTGIVLGEDMDKRTNILLSDLKKFEVKK